MSSSRTRAVARDCLTWVAGLDRGWKATLLGLALVVAVLLVQ